NSAAVNGHFFTVTGIHTHPAFIDVDLRPVIAVYDHRVAVNRGFPACTVQALQPALRHFPGTVDHVVVVNIADVVDVKNEILKALVKADLSSNRDAKHQLD